MAEPLRAVPSRSVIVGWDFSTGSVKCLAFDLEGRAIAGVRFPTDLWESRSPEGACELNLMQLEGQARASARGIAAELKSIGRLKDWIAGGISATHHTAGRIDRAHNQVRRAICWNDRTLAPYRARGERRLGGAKRVRELIGGPWADRYTLSHLVKDEDADYGGEEIWKRTYRVLPHGALAAGYLTGRFDAISVSAAASTGIMDFRTGEWAPAMLGALASQEHRRMALTQLPRIVDQFEPLGPLSESVAIETGLEAGHRPLIFPTSDDQQAGLVGGGAVDSGEMAVILGNSAVVNSSSDVLPRYEQVRGGCPLDLMRLNWGPYLWMRCYNNGAQFLDRVLGAKVDWNAIERRGRAIPPGAGGFSVLPFLYPEPSLRVSTLPGSLWVPREPSDAGQRYRAALEAIAFLIAHGVDEHRQAGREIRRITVSGGIARSDLMCEILASVLNHPLERLESDEGPALGAAVTALAAIETTLRRRQQIADPYTVADAVSRLVRFRARVEPIREWAEAYRALRRNFENRVAGLGRADRNFGISRPVRPARARGKKAATRRRAVGKLNAKTRSRR